MDEVSDRIAGLPPQKLELLLKRLVQKGAGAPRSAIHQVSRASSTFPLSLAQRRLWFLEQLAPGTAMYNLPLAARLSGRLDIVALERAIAALRRRHETLRTVFRIVDGQPVQVILPLPGDGEAPAPLPFVDLRHLPAAEREAAARKLADEEARTPFDLGADPPLRVRLLRLDAEEHIFLVTMHHLVSDGWSLGVFLNELALLQSAFAGNRPPALPDLPVQYVDVAEWQRQELTGAALERQLAYWKQQLGGPLPALELPTDRPRPALQSYHGEQHPLALSPELSDALKELCQREGVTIFMALLAAFKVLLHRYTGQTDLLVGSPIANRTRPELEGLIGCFVNTLVLRSDLSGNPSFRELLGRVRATALGAYDHKDLPFERLVEALQPERDLSRAPLFQTMLVHMDAPLKAVELAGLTMSPLPSANGTSQFDLSLYLFQGAGALGGFVEYNTELFERATIARLAGQFQTLLAAAVADPTRPIAQLPMLTPAERRYLLVERNQTRAAYPDSLCLHHLVEAQAALHPHKLAVCFDAGDGEPTHGLSYGTLEARANRVAHALLGRGIAPGSLVGICLERSLDLVVGLLGILKAGCAYLPLDPAYPAERLAFMLADSAAPLVFTRRSLRELIPAPVELLCLDDEALLAAQPSTPPALPIGPEQLAYVIYTSGSTGQPKGVQIPHRALVNFLASMQRRPGISPDDTLLAVTTLSFDIAALELFLPLSVGARVALVSREAAADGLRLARAIERQQATIMQATPATWQLLLASGWQGQEGLKILCGGEAFPRALAAQLLGKGQAVWNMYGPTETTIWSSVSELREEEGPVLLGEPIANTQFYVLNRHGELAPLGVAGELYIGGDGLALGYWRREELTAEKFVADRFGGREGGRLYRTGDLVRARADGRYEFLGRLDQQIKLRGYRVELGEVEVALERHEAVRQAVAAVRELGAGDTRLVGYVVPEAGARASGEELRVWLRQSLPEYMVPSQIVLLDALPLTLNGKVDRRSLPDPDAARPAGERALVPPRTATEAALAAIWRETLGIEQVGVEDSFFELGGHSLLATQLIFRVQTTMGVELPMLSFFTAPTIANLARAIDARRQGAHDGAPQHTAALRPALDLRAEAVLDPAIAPPDALPAGPGAPQAILLTGASGFVGAFLLDELLRRTQAKLYCLVRAAEPEAGRRRLVQALAGFQLWQDAYGERIIPVVGDLARPLCGLTPAQFQELAATLDLIYHCGAVTGFIYPYSELKGPNVGGTQEILRLACQFKTKPVHYLSSLYVFSPLDLAARPVVGEADQPEGWEGLGLGYTQSKWVAEGLVREAQARGLPASIYRLGRIAGHSRSGAGRSDDFVWQLIRACVETASVPDLHSPVDLTPVDYAAAAVAQLAAGGGSAGATYHVLNQQPPALDDIVAWMRADGYPLERVAYAEWRARLLGMAAQSSASAAAGLVPLLPPDAGDLQMGSLHVDDRNTRAGLAPAAIVCPPVDRQLFGRYLAYFKRSGFLRPPQ